ncbi:MAG: ABC transporter ATP-binding protein [Lachnospiraceae bacterium]|nr:ABC transporter ATP-binding protein [Lachnospiraceae bacterium]
MLEIKNIHKTFNPGTINEKVALNGVDLTLKEGDFVTIIGGNGAGKSTMLNAIAGLWPVDQGNIIIDGVDVTALSDFKRAAYLGRVFQDPMTGTAATMSIEENLAIAARRGEKRGLGWGVSKKEREQYHELLKTLDLGLEDRLSSKVGLLSGGQRQAITLLMASLKKPKLLLLDEHTAALDPKTAEKVLKLSDKIVSENNLTALMVTHNMKDAIAHGNRLIMMMEGKIIYDVEGEEKKALKVSDLLQKFEEVSGGEFANDRMMLS